MLIVKYDINMWLAKPAHVLSQQKLELVMTKKSCYGCVKALSYILK